MKYVFYLFVLAAVTLGLFGLVGVAAYLHISDKDPSGWALAAGCFAAFVFLPVVAGICNEVAGTSNTEDENDEPIEED